MRVIVANGLGEERLAACLEALHAAAPGWDPEIHVARERGTREATWNAALDEVGRDQDVLFLGDDVRLSPGFREALEAGAAEAEIVGLCTLEPGTARVQDRGYRLVRLDGRVTVEALERGRVLDEVAPFGVRPCDAVCGCLFLVKSVVLERIRRFRPEGMNRWGELVFALEARGIGARVVVVEHYVEHAAEGSKAKSDPQLASTSYGTEQQLWSRLVDRFVRPGWVAEERTTRIEPGLRRFLEAPRPLILYGAGTVCETLLAAVPVPDARLVLCSGLPEEWGTRFRGHPIRSPDELDWAGEAGVLVTPLQRGAKIVQDVLAPHLPVGFHGELGWVTRRQAGAEDVLGLELAETRPPPLGSR